MYNVPYCGVSKRTVRLLLRCRRRLDQGSVNSRRTVAAVEAVASGLWLVKSCSQAPTDRLTVRATALYRHSKQGGSVSFHRIIQSIVRLHRSQLNACLANKEHLNQIKRLFSGSLAAAARTRHNWPIMSLCNPAQNNLRQQPHFRVGPKQNSFVDRHVTAQQMIMAYLPKLLRIVVCIVSFGSLKPMSLHNMHGISQFCRPKLS